MTGSVPKLRGHHLVCLHFFEGEGYDERFVKNLHDVVLSAKLGGVTVCAGTDDVCEPCPYLVSGICRDEKGIGKMDEKAVTLLRITEGTRYGWDALEAEVRKMFPTWYRNYCRGCAWMDACERSEKFRSLVEGL